MESYGKVLDTLTLDRNIKNMFYQENITTLKAVCTALIEYKLMSQEEFEEWVNEDYTSIMTLLPDVMIRYLNVMHLVDFERNPLFDTFERDLGIVIEDGEVANVYLPLGFDITERIAGKDPKILIENKISRHTVNYHYVSPEWVRAKLGIEREKIYTLLYKSIILDAMKRKASDITFSTVNEAGEYVNTVNYRINKGYFRVDKFSGMPSEDFEKLFDALLKGTGRERTSVTNRYGVTYAVANVFGADNTILRGSLSMVTGGYDNSLRIQTQDSLKLTLSLLGFDRETEDIMKRTAYRREGLTLFTGPINTGKSISMMAVSKETEKLDVKQYGLFDPQEFLVPYSSKDYAGDMETLVNEVTYMKKKDVDVAYVSEIPNREVAIQLKDLIVTNVHVIATTHLNRSWDIPNKLEGLYGEDWINILSYLNTVFNQKMFIKACPHCGKIEPVDLAMINPMYREFAEKYGVRDYRNSKGCDKCIDGEVIGGYNPIAEFIDFTPELVAEMLEKKTLVGMSMYLRKHLISNEKSLEFKVAKAINEGKIVLNSIEEFI